ncbi:hypothetical protein BN1013_00608 [Candidatus Rubidus massiliensis]|nr:hypothetical protein BN1013_00608 [Candidatus Rubidus massiliensis]
MIEQSTSSVSIISAKLSNQSNPKKDVLNLKNVSFNEIVQSLSQKFESNLKKIKFGPFDFKNHTHLFQTLVKSIEDNQYRGWIHLSKNCLNEEQWQKLNDLCSKNHLKGLQIYAIDYPKGVVPGFYDMNHTLYNEEKSEVVDSQVRWILTQSLHRFFPDKNIDAIFDFGAGQSPEALYMARKGIEIKTYVAVDHDGDELDKLEERLPDSYKAKLEKFKDPFVTYNGQKSFDLFLACFTFPYRTKADFPQVWNKAVSLIKMGGIMAFHLYGEPLQKNQSHTYHTLHEIENLLKKEFSEFEIVEENKACQNVYHHFYSEGNKFQIKTLENFTFTETYGGENPEWGILYHIIAKKI